MFYCMICYRGDCSAVQLVLCDYEWGKLEQNKQNGVYLKNRGHLRLPDCSKLPLHSTNPESCTKVDLFDIKEDLITSKLSDGMF